MARNPVGENRLLSRLSSGDLSILRPQLKAFALVRGRVLHPLGTQIAHIYFPLSGMISLVAVTKSGAQVETGVVGREGVVGVSVANYGKYPFGQATVQIEGAALRMPTDAFVKIFHASEPFRRAMNGFQSVILWQALQSAVCHALHTVEARLCRWLLQTQDAIGSDVIPLTQEFLSYMLGVQRNAVSLSAAGLHERGLIAYSRGKIRILDREGLRRASCECYDVVSQHANRIARPKAK